MNKLVERKIIEIAMRREAGMDCHDCILEHLCWEDENFKSVSCENMFATWLKSEKENEL